MQIKQLVKLLATNLLISQSLVACVGGNTQQVSNNASSAKVNTNTASAVLKSSLDDNDVWVNVTQVDAANHPSNVAFYNENRSNSDVSLVGCDDTAYIDNHLAKSIPAHSYSPMTKDYASKWSYLDAGNGIFDKKNLFDSYLHFSNAPKYADNNFNCYYSIKVPGVKQSMYFKMVNHAYNFATVSPITSINDTAPAKAAAYSYNSTRPFWAMVPAGLGGIAISAVPWAAYKSRWMSEVSAATAMDEKIKVLFKDELLTITNNIFVARRNPVAYGQLNRFRELFNVPFKYTDRELLKVLDRLPYEGKNYVLAQINVVKNNGSYAMELLLRRMDVTAEGGIITERINMQTEFAKAKEMLPWLHDETVLTGDSFAIKNAETIALENGIDVQAAEASSRLAAFYTAREAEIIGIGELGLGVSEIGQNLVMREVGENVVTRGLMKAGFTKLGSKIAGVIGVGAGVGVVAAGFITSAFVHDNPFGNYNTAVNHLSLNVPTEAEAIAWNKSHDADHQIFSNTNYAPPAPQEAKQGNTALMNSGIFTYKDTSDVDSHIGAVVSLNATSTPFVRLDRDNAGAPVDDPYLGNIQISQGDDSAYSAVVQMTIADVSNVSPIKDLDYQTNMVQMQSMGLNQLATDERYEAPNVSITQMVNSKTGKTLFSRGQNKQGLLSAGRSGLLKVGRFEGLFLNNNQQIQASTALPAVSSSAGDSQGLLGGGFGTYYKEEDSTGSSTGDFLAVKSNSLKAMYDGESTAPGYLFSKFNCSYPLPVGKQCDLQLGIGGIHDNKKHMGHLYVADAASKTKSLPVYINYHLVSEPELAQVDPTGQQYPSTFTLTMQNTSSDNYAKVVLLGLPDGVELVANTDGTPSCEVGLASGEGCSSTYSVANVSGSGKYDINIQGITAKNINKKAVLKDEKDADTEQLTLNVMSGF